MYHYKQQFLADWQRKWWHEKYQTSAWLATLIVAGCFLISGFAH